MVGGEFMRYIIDACNLMFRDRKLEETLETQGFQAARTLLSALLTRFARAEDAGEITLVFDGSEKGAHRPRRQVESGGRLVLVYADPRENADRFIIDAVETARRPGEITVVSSDKFIVRHAQRAGAKTAGCRDFMRQLRGTLRRAADPYRGEDRRKFGAALTPREIEEWMKYFGFEAHD